MARRARLILGGYHIVVGKGVYSGREGWILGVSHIVVERGGAYSGREEEILGASINFVVV